MMAGAPDLSSPSPSSAREFYDRDYFEGGKRDSPAHTHETIYPLIEPTAVFLTRLYHPGTVVDLGCAKGYLVEAFQKTGIEKTFGMDVSTYAVSAGGTSTRGRLLVGDVAAGIPLRSGSFDLVTGLDLFEHLHDPAPVLAEIRRILSAGGVAYLKICHPRHANAQRDPSHVNVRPLPYWRNEFLRAGFCCRRVFEADFGTPAGPVERLKFLLRRFREWAVIGNPADYKFLLEGNPRSPSGAEE
ncbi:MAG: class I SAM-dependent methyltransferase [Acidobacteriota bacterium]